MKLTDISGTFGQWLSGTGPLAEVVLSSRIRLARNLAGHRFVNRCTSEEKAQILETLREVLLSIELTEERFFVEIDQASDLTRSFLVERHLISRHHAMGKGPRGAVIAKGEYFTGMINEEDHLRLQVLMSGCQLGRCAELINQIDDMIERRVEYAFHPRFGYLTACPTNVGTGIRVSVMLHLPCLKMVGHLDRFLNAARDMNLAVRGLFGEGTEAIGDLYQVSNQVTLGVSEQDLVRQSEQNIIPEIVEYENAARRKLLADQQETIDDKIARATALLQSAQLVSSHEALTLLSHLRLGISMRRCLGASTPAIDRLCGLFGHDPCKDTKAIEVLNRLLLTTLPAHLQLNYGKALETYQRDALRAKIIRAALGGGS
ncbi:MAG: protein arginine kinase [Sedimentisphaerales bacterium]|nr:protein arginine kinase [Sedimentisphaerales bacterium]